MSPERNQYRVRFEEVTEKAKEITLQDGQHVPVLIVEGSKSLVVSQIQAMPDTHGERLELMRFFGQAALPDIRFHDLRHTAATLILQQHTHPKVVQERLGHSDIALTLNTYSHVLPDIQEEAAEKITRALMSKK